MSIDYRSLAKSLIQELTGDRNVISIPRKFIDLTGDLNSAAILNQILYWSSRTKDPDGWFYKTYSEWQEEIGLTQYQVKRAITGDKRTKKDNLVLSDLGVQTIRKKRGNAVKLHYRIDMEVFFIQFDNFLNMNNVDNQNMNNVDNPYTETTTETTEKTLASPDGNAQTVLQTDAALYGESVIEADDLIPVAAAQHEGKPENGKDVNKGICELIDVWLTEQSIIDSGAYRKTGYRSTCKDLYLQGITPDDLRGFIQARKKEPFWQDIAISWNHIRQNIANWKAKSTTTKSKPAHDDVLPPYVPE